MISKPILILLVCSGALIIIQSLMPKTMAMRSTKNMDEYIVEDQRTRKKHNDMIQSARIIDKLQNQKNNGLMYDTEPFDLDTNAEDLTNFMMDYANMIKNDVILLDNSIETRTRKRGNIKLEKYNQAIQDPPCSCEYKKQTKDFGENAYPRHVEIRNCSRVQQQSCLFPYICKETLYNASGCPLFLLMLSEDVVENYILSVEWGLTLNCSCRNKPMSTCRQTFYLMVLIILKRRESPTQQSLEVPNEWKFNWIAEKWPVSVGCVCTRDYVL